MNTLLYYRFYKKNIFVDNLSLNTNYDNNLISYVSNRICMEIALASGIIHVESLFASTTIS